MEELLLWRWSTAVQISSAVLVAVFFVVFGRSTGRLELRWWVAAWVSNGVALGVTWAFWLWQPGPGWSDLLRGCYLASKTLFLLLMLLGTLAFDHAALARRWLPGCVAVALLYALAGALTLDSISALGLSQSSLIAFVLLAAGIACARTAGGGMGWLGVGFALRGLLALAEATAYGWQHFAGRDDLPGYVGTFLASHSSFDTGAEWVIALGCVLALAHRTHAELERSHAELHQAHHELQRVAERDPLTGLYNRRMLNSVFARMAARGGVVAFFDLDDFKRINDSLGHAVGDACLRRFAAALEAALPRAEGLLRFAGDEFVALLSGDEAARVATAVAALRAALEQPAGSVPALRCSVGISRLAAGGDPLAALREADLAMYRDKLARRREETAS